jgi:LmbE family N-acetylglucosaminyl deacetylase
MRRTPSLLVLAAVVFATAAASADPRPPELMNAAQLKIALRKLQVTGTALYVGAHPDDENTAMLAYLANGRMVRTAYLSLTRGDGGQNLLGREIGEPLGVIRTQELLAARKVDAAEQYFSRALDFGFSKNADETLRFWGHDRILADAVWVIRELQPDVIVTRFRPDSTAGHGHHIASSIIAGEAFDAAADPKRFPEQLKYVKPWQAKRLVWNAYRFGATGVDTTPGRVRIDLGTFDPLLGRSYTEMAGESRSMHQSQGAGTPERRGEWVNTFENRLGERATNDLFEGVDLTWSRIPGGAKVGTLLRDAEKALDSDHPAAILAKLAEAHAAMAKLPDSPIVVAKRRELLEVIRTCSGLWIEALAAAPTATPGSKLGVRLTMVNRSSAALVLERVTFPYGDARISGAPEGQLVSASGGWSRPLTPNQPMTIESMQSLPADLPITQPYWLRERTLKGSFEVADAQLIGTPENAPAVNARVELSLAGEKLAFDAPVVYKWLDPVYGDRYRALEIAPPVSCRFEESAYLFGDTAPRTVRIVVQSADTLVEGTARLALPQGWKATPTEAPVRLRGFGAETTVSFTVTAGSGAASGVMSASVEEGGQRYTRNRVRIDYPHIPVQVLFPLAEAKLVKTPVRHSGERIAYLMGSGDQGPEALRQMGFQVTLLTDDEVQSMDLSKFQTIVAGVRVYNTRPRLRALQPRLLDYVKEGGRLVIQYQTADAELKDRLGPYPFTISRDRVTDEEAPMRTIAAQHPLLNSPNKIGPDDFTGWVQERGLYFANPYDSHYETVLSANDTNEPARDGGLLYARWGKGVFIYSGFAWFRQLPAGVPGAYRLFANLVSATPPAPAPAP